MSTHIKCHAGPDTIATSRAEETIGNKIRRKCGIGRKQQKKIFIYFKKKVA